MTRLNTQLNKANANTPSCAVSPDTGATTLGGFALVKDEL